MQLIGLDLYSFSEAARLTGIAPVELRRWLRGHGRTGQDAPEHLPLWRSELAAADIESGFVIRRLGEP